MKLWRQIAVFGICGLFWSSVGAEPSGEWTALMQVRPYIGGNTAYVYPNSSSSCGVNISTIDLGSAAGRAAYATALTAVATGKRVMLEVVACSGLYTQLQSIYIGTD